MLQFSFLSMGFKDYIKKKQRERTERQRAEEEDSQKINDLLDKFEIPDFDLFFEKVLGFRPKTEYEYDDRLKKDVPKPTSRKDYLDFIFNVIADNETSYKQLEGFAIKHKVLPPSFFGVDSDVSGDANEFENIINSIHRGFDPEKITGEEHLQSQLSVFLKAKFPDKKVEREVITKNNDKLDILIDNKYVFEIKVPKNRTELRNLNAQIEEYIEQYPKLCVVIADISKVDETDESIESNLTQNIKEYSDKYKVKHGVQTLIFDIGKRK